MSEDNGWVRDAEGFWDDIPDLVHYLKDLQDDLVLCQTEHFAYELDFAMRKTP